MATLTAQQLAELRRRLASNTSGYTWTKQDVNLALQTVEDWFESNKSSLNTAVDAATGSKFSGPEKKLLIAYWLFQKAGREA
jgi:hypothetical protein